MINSFKIYWVSCLVITSNVQMKENQKNTVPDSAASKLQLFLLLDILQRILLVGNSISSTRGREIINLQCSKVVLTHAVTKFRGRKNANDIWETPNFHSYKSNSNMTPCIMIWIHKNYIFLKYIFFRKKKKTVFPGDWNYTYRKDPCPKLGFYFYFIFSVYVFIYLITSQR